MSAARPTVLVFSGLDPSGGAGLSADIMAIAGQGAHALPLVTALTAQDNNRVHEVVPVDAALLTRQAQILIGTFDIGAVKLGIPGNRANAEAIAALIVQLRARRPTLPVVLDPVLASGHGDALGRGNALAALAPLLAVATLVTPNLGEAQALDLGACRHVLITGGHGEGAFVANRWYCADPADGAGGEWRWPRLDGEFHGSGCTLAAAIAARLALGEAMAAALQGAQDYTQQALAQSFAIAAGQRIPQRFLESEPKSAPARVSAPLASAPLFT